jgi:hypothetical protein
MRKLAGEEGSGSSENSCQSRIKVKCRKKICMPEERWQSRSN